MILCCVLIEQVERQRKIAAKKAENGREEET